MISRLAAQRALAGNRSSLLVRCFADNRSKPESTIDLAKWFRFNDSGMRAFNEGNLDKAEEYFNIAIEVRRKFRDLSFAASLANLAAVWKCQKRIDIAKEHFEEAIDILEVIGAKEKASSTLTNSYIELGDIEFEMEQFEPALKSFQSALALMEKFQQPLRLQARAKFGKARALHMLKKFSEAEAEYLKTIEDLKNIHGDHHANIGECYRSLAVLNADVGQVNEAGQYYLEAMEQYKELNPKMLPELVIEYTQLLGANSELLSSQMVSQDILRQTAKAIKRAKRMAEGLPVNENEEEDDDDDDDQLDLDLIAPESENPPPTPTSETKN